MLLLLTLACRTPTVPDPTLALPDPPTWPERGTPLASVDPTFPASFGIRKITLDAGHGTGDNLGSTTVHCVKEADVVLALAGDLADRLEATGHFEVRLSRSSADGPSYSRRLRDAHDSEALISVHTDARGNPWEWGCWRDENEPGFAILWADRGDEALVAQRGVLAHSLARHLTATGITPYDGDMYGERYDRDEVPGAYLDRRVLFMLRRPEVPSLILEVYNGLSVSEGDRWEEDATRQVLADALSAALIDALE